MPPELRIRGTRPTHDLQLLPSPYLSSVITPTAEIRWETQRGCRFKCSFCQHHEPGSRLQNHLLGISRLEKEVQLFARHGVRRISVLDPIFHDNQAHAIELLRLIRQTDLKAHLALKCRFETITDDFLDALGGLSETLEFGLQTAIAEEAKLIDRPNRLNIVERVIDKLHARRIDVEVSLIYGLPGQTLASFKRSVAWCHQRSIPRIKAWPLMLLRGTKLYEQKAQFGLTESSDRRIPLVISSHIFSATQYESMQFLAEAL
jgi:radical SAM superfamily enzyme